MSKVDNTNGDLVLRRHPVTQITPREAIEKLNEIVDETNAHVARIEAQRVAWEAVAVELQAEIDFLKAALRDIANCKQLGDAKGIARTAL